MIVKHTASFMFEGNRNFLAHKNTNFQTALTIWWLDDNWLMILLIVKWLKHFQSFLTI